ncbi:MAG TPA: S1 RNA-binding domain-containing protein, partial [Bryobacterales bacterium]|nr:S1 RNA-binding domain-containing protein [Bryobacterales bacterium]
MPSPAAGREPESTGAEPDTSFGDILSRFEQAHASPPQHDGEGREGVVIAVSGDSVFVDIGLKIEGLMPLSEFRGTNGEVSIHPGDKLRVGIT